MNEFRRFYEIAKLNLGESIFIDSEHIEVDLTFADRIVVDDNGFRSALGPNAAFWVSGGGTAVIRGRYLPIVQRSQTAINNPGKLSLFTGRADNRGEWLEPRTLVRELFEEMILIADGRPVRPAIPVGQSIADAAWQRILRSGAALDSAPIAVPFHPIALPTRHVEIRNGVERAVHDLCCHMNSRGDVNVLFAYAVDLDPATLTARDGEYTEYNGTIDFHERSIFLFDAIELTIRPLSGAGPERPIDPTATMTEHLLALLEMLNLHSSTRD